MKGLKNFFAFLFLLLTYNPILCKEIIVSPNIPDALVAAVSNANSKDVLILKDAGVYPISSSLLVEVSLTIKAEENFIIKPKIVFASDSSDNYPDNMINTNASLTLIDIIADGRQGGISPYSSRFINRGDITGGKIHVDGIEVSRFKAISMGGDCDTLIVENSLFNGNLSGAGDWGGTWYFENDYIKYAKIKNNTFMFCTFGPFINNGWSAYPRYNNQLITLIIDHNTFYNITGAHGPTTMFQNTKNVQFTNNLYINGTFRPLEFFSDKYNDFPENDDHIYPNGDISILGPNGGWIIRASMCDTANTQIIMRNNNISYTSDILAKWDSLGLGKPWIYTNETKMAIVDTNAAYFEEVLVFNDAPAVPMFAIKPIAEYCAIANVAMASGDSTYKSTTPYQGWDWWDAEGNAIFDYRESAYMDLRYNSDSKSYTAGDGGFPLGDLNWWPEWDPTSIGDSKTNLISEFDLGQNYPNPFNPTTTINYTVKTTADVKLFIYNSIGQRVKVLVDGYSASGLQTVIWDGTNDANENVASGIYLFRLEAASYSKTRKMILLR